MLEKKKENKTRVGILRGGENEYYLHSLKKGGDIIAHIFENLFELYSVVDILVDKNGIWHINGIPTDKNNLKEKVDVVWDTSKYTDLYKILNELNIPVVGNDEFLNSLEENKDKLKKHLKEIGVNVPRSILFPTYQQDFDGEKKDFILKKAQEVFNKFSAPWIIKSFTPDTSMGIHLAKTFPELVESIEDCVNHNKSILVEEFIQGRVSSVHSISMFRNQDVYVLPPENFSVGEKEKIISNIKNIHLHLGAKHYLKTDFVIHPRRGFFVTEINFSPDLRKNSHLEKSCENIGAKPHHVSKHILEKVFKNSN